MTQTKPICRAGFVDGPDPLLRLPIPGTERPREAGKGGIAPPQAASSPFGAAVVHLKKCALPPSGANG